MCESPWTFGMTSSYAVGAGKGVDGFRPGYKMCSTPCRHKQSREKKSPVQALGRKKDETEGVVPYQEREFLIALVRADIWTFFCHYHKKPLDY